jgi:hypothetical protein
LSAERNRGCDHGVHRWPPFPSFSIVLHQPANSFIEFHTFSLEDGISSKECKTVEKTDSKKKYIKKCRKIEVAQTKSSLATKMESAKGSIGLYLYATEDEDIGDEAQTQAKKEEEKETFRGAAYAATGEGGQDIYEVLDGGEGSNNSYNSHYEDCLVQSLPTVASHHQHGDKPRSLTNSIERIARSEPAEDEADAVYEFTADGQQDGDDDGRKQAGASASAGAGLLDGSDSNERFQRWMSSKDSLQKYVLLSQHARDFVHAASTFGTGCLLGLWLMVHVVLVSSCLTFLFPV